MNNYSGQALASMRAVIPTDEQRVFDFIASRGVNGATCDETEAALGLSHQNCSARFTKLSDKKNPRITLSGETRRTRSGRPAGVYCDVALVRA